MRIEVVAETDAPTTVKGNLLESLAVDFLASRHFSVETQARLTATELDLLRTHKVNQKEIILRVRS